MLSKCRYLQTNKSVFNQWKNANSVLTSIGIELYTKIRLLHLIQYFSRTLAIKSQSFISFPSSETGTPAVDCTNTKQGRSSCEHTVDYIIGRENTTKIFIPLKPIFTSWGSSLVCASGLHHCRIFSKGGTILGSSISPPSLPYNPPSG